jgi:class 3 adenylate cyclase
MAERNADIPPTNRIEFRMGINVGDVVAENGDIFGDGVNVAVRLEGLRSLEAFACLPEFRRTLRVGSTSPSTIWAGGW